MSSLFTYSPSEVTLVVGGYTITGWEKISISKNAPAFIPIRGIRGKNTRVRNTDTSVTLSVPLLQTSMGNDVFSRIHALDIERGTGRLEITLKDASGTGVFSSSEAYITDYPVVAYSGNFEYRVWTIFAQSTNTYNVGGNGKVDNIFDSILGAANKVVDKVSSFL